MSENENLCPDGASAAERIKALLQRIDAHEAEGAAIETLTKGLGLDAKRIRAIRAAQKTLDALMGVDPATAARVTP